MHHAARWCKTKAIEVLKELGGEINSKSKNDDAPIHISASKSFCLKTNRKLLDLGADIDDIGEHEETPLYKTVKFGLLDLVQLFIDRGADKAKRNSLGKTPLERAQGDLKKNVEKLERRKKEYQKCLEEKKLDPEKYCFDDFRYIEKEINDLKKIVALLMS